MVIKFGSYTPRDFWWLLFRFSFEVSMIFIFLVGFVEKVGVFKGFCGFFSF